MAPSDKVIAGVVVAVATVPLIPFAAVIEVLVTVPVPDGGIAKVPSPLKNAVVLFGGVGTAPPTVAVMTGRSPPVAIVSKPVVVAFLRIPVVSAPRNCDPVKPASDVPPTMYLLASVILADPLKLVPAIVRAVVSVAAEPVVFWFHIGIDPDRSEYGIDPIVSVPIVVKFASAVKVVLDVAVIFAAVPVVLWLSVGKVQLVKVPEYGVPRAPPEIK